MKGGILAFGIAKDIFGVKALEMETEGLTVADLKQQLETIYPRLGKLASYMVAVNDEYVTDDYILKATDEVAIIPPVSGG